MTTTDNRSVEQLQERELFLEMRIEVLEAALKDAETCEVCATLETLEKSQ